MACKMYFAALRPDQFETKPSNRRSKYRDKARLSIKKIGQQRRILVSPNGEIICRSDIPFYQALVSVGYIKIAVVVVAGQAKRADIKAAKAFSAEHPVTTMRDGVLHPRPYLSVFREYAEWLNGTRAY
jgi:hypothetical protein